MIATRRVTDGLKHVQFLPFAADAGPVSACAFDGLSDYALRLAEMEREVDAIALGKAPESLWMLEHPPLYTAGTSAQDADLIAPDRFPVFRTGRGGEYTYHGPGQSVGYVMLDLKRRRQDVRAFVHALEEWCIETLAEFGVQGERRSDRVGVWVVRKDRPQRPDGSFAEDKIAAIGIRLRRWVSFHGVALNVSPNLEHFSGIVPCGVVGHGVTSLNDLGIEATMDDVRRAKLIAFARIFGQVEPR